MQPRRFGRTGLSVPPIATGGTAFAYVHKSADWNPTTPDGQKAAHAPLHHALDRDVTYIDTAAAAGNRYSKTLVGAVLQTRRADCTLAPKSGPTSATPRWWLFFGLGRHRC